MATSGARFRENGPALFLTCCFAVLLAASVLLLIVKALPVSLETLSDPGRRWALSVLPAEDTASLKLRWAGSQPRYDVGLFGNSRAVMVGEPELAIQPRRAFNFSIPGHSIRQSIRLLEQLRLEGRVPSIVLISLDHVELGQPGGGGAFPPPPWRWLLLFRDVWHVGLDWGWRAAAVAAYNGLDSEGRMTALAFNHTYLASKLGAVLGRTGSQQEFRADGSRVYPSDPGAPLRLDPPKPRADLYRELEDDFAKLTALRNDGTRVVVYESPMPPAMLEQVERRLSPNAAAVRDRFRKACVRYDLECHGPPVLAGSGWSDATHPPAGLLGGWLRSIIVNR
jgi:hypothetical protein